MVNRRGFMRMIELVIAIILISGILIIIYRQNIPAQKTQELSELSRDILAEISTKENLRVEIINSKQNASRMIQTLNFINNSVPDYISFELRACLVTSACGQSAYVGDVFSAERIISASNNKFNPTKLRLFLWVPQKQ